MNDKHFVSDLHFFHKNIMKFTRRPFFSLDEMHESIIREWNQSVAKGDTVYHLGDLSFLSGKFDQKPLYDILNQLNGTLICLKGNHDYSNLIEKHFEAISKGDLRSGIYFKRTPYEEIKVNKKKVILCHYPIISFNRQHHGAYHLFGHCHNNLSTEVVKGKMMDVGYDALWENWGMKRPISFDEISGILGSRDIYVWDHHQNRGIN